MQIPEMQKKKKKKKKNEKIGFDFETIAFELVALNSGFY